MASDQVETFLGQRIDEMSRDELILAVKTLGRMLSEQNAAAIKGYEIQRMAREARERQRTPREHFHQDGNGTDGNVSTMFSRRQS